MLARCLVLAVLLQPLPGWSRTILLQSFAGDPAPDATHYVDFLLRSLGKEAPLAGSALRQEVETHLSISSGALPSPRGIRASVEEGKRQFIEGEFTAAIAQLEEARRLLLQEVALVASDQSLRDALHKALLFLAHGYLRTGQGERATDRVSDVIRSFPDRDLSLVQYGPELVRLYKNVRRGLDQQQRGTLTITTRPAGSLVFVNERYVGLSPARVVDLYSGRYRVYVQRPGVRGRVHPVNVSGADHQVTIDLDLDSVLRTQPYVGFRFAERGTRDRQEIPFAATVGQALEASTVLLLGFRRHQGHRALLGRTIAIATGRVIRSGMVLLEPAPPAPATLKALGRFLIAGEEGSDLIIHSSGTGGLPGARAPVPAGGRRFFSARVFKWITLGLGLASLGAGIPLLVLHGRGTCDAPESGRCPEKYDTQIPGIILTAAGGLSAGGSALLFYLDARREGPRLSLVLGGPGGWGLSAAFTY